MIHGIVECNSFSGAIRNITTSSYTVAKPDYCLVCNIASAGSSITIQLPLASELAGRVLVIKRLTGVTSRRVFLQRAGTNLVDGQTSINFGNNYASVTIISDGVSNWYVI
jgi:hypothetical protein